MVGCMHLELEIQYLLNVCSFELLNTSNFFYPKLKCYVILLWLNEITQTEIAWLITPYGGGL